MVEGLDNLVGLNKMFCLQCVCYNGIDDLKVFLCLYIFCKNCFMLVVEGGCLKCLKCWLNVLFLEVGIDGLFMNIFSYNIFDVLVLSQGNIELSSLI